MDLFSQGMQDRKERRWNLFKNMHGFSITVRATGGEGFRDMDLRVDSQLGPSILKE